MSTLSYCLKIAASDDNNSSTFLEGPLQRSLKTLFSTHCLLSLLLMDNHFFFFTGLSHWQLNSWKWQWKRRINSAPIKGYKVPEQENTLRDWEESLVSKKFLLHFTEPCLPGLVPGLSSPPFNAHLLIKHCPTTLRWETSKAVKVLSLYRQTTLRTTTVKIQRWKMSRGGIVQVCEMRRDGPADRQTGLHPEHRGTLVSFKWEHRSINWKGGSLAWRRRQEKFNSLCGVSAGLGFNRQGTKHRVLTADERHTT